MSYAIPNCNLPQKSDDTEEKTNEESLDFNTGNQSVDQIAEKFIAILKMQVVWDLDTLLPEVSFLLSWVKLKLQFSFN